MLAANLAKHFRGVFFGPNWTASNLKEHLSDVTLEEATSQIGGLNTIAKLAFHISYYVDGGMIAVLSGGKLEIKDQFSYDAPEFHSESEWKQFVDKIFTDAEKAASLIESLPESKLYEPFTDEKYGSYLRNILGVIEHTHYHLGQIVLLKKKIRS